jgi:hypothetical protein
MKREFELYPIVKDYLEREGLCVFIDAPIGRWTTRRVDVLGVNYEKEYLVAVEVKIRDERKALEQAFTRLFFSDIVFVAFPEPHAYYVRNRMENMLMRYGIGVLAINNSVRRILEPRSSKFLNPLRKHLIIEKLRRDGEH